ncbi:MAG: DNA/RNA non-specific endonuclease [Acidobacteriota bacterium]|nr:DNA/RNA non-specific endonuclease [Acidobacteriota bacterium]
MLLVKKSKPPRRSRPKKKGRGSSARKARKESRDQSALARASKPVQTVARKAPVRLPEPPKPKKAATENIPVRRPQPVKAAPEKGPTPESPATRQVQAPDASAAGAPGISETPAATPPAATTAPGSGAGPAASEAPAAKETAPEIKAEKAEVSKGESGEKSTRKGAAAKAGGKAGAGAADDRAGLNKALANLKKEAVQQQGAAANSGTAMAASDSAVSNATSATPAPANEAGAYGAAAQVDVMGEQKAGQVEPKSFLDLVKSILDKVEPPTPEQMDDIGESGVSEQFTGGLREAVSGQVTKAGGDIAGAAGAEPTPADPKEAVPLAAQPAGPQVGPIGAENALPNPRSDDEVSLEQNRLEMEGEFQRENLTPERLEKANDPRFSRAQKARETATRHSQEAPMQYRQEETAFLGQQRAQAQASEGPFGQSMMSARTNANQSVAGGQQTQMTEEQQKRAALAEKLNAIYTETETIVNGKLEALDEEVDREFTILEEAALIVFEKYIDDKMLVWKIKRYGKADGFLTWIGDQFGDINELPEVEKIYKDGQAVFRRALEIGIIKIGKIVDRVLAECKAEIKKGKEKLKAEIDALDDNMKAFAARSAAGILEKFNTLAEDVNNKREEMASQLADRYQQAHERMNEKLEEIKSANKGLVTAAVEAVGEIIEAIRQFRERLSSMLTEAKSVIEEILEDPIGFLKNLLRAVKEGFTRFSNNIWEHLKAGLLGWMFGALATMGIKLPSEFSVKAVVGFVLSLLGLTWDRLRPKVVRLIGARNVAILEKVVGYMTTLFREGPAGLWEEIKEDLGNLKDMIIEQVQNWLITQIIEKAVTKLAGMFNPVGAIIQAVMMIYNTVMFFVERINQILDLVQSIIRSLGAIVRGNIEEAANKVEQTLALTLPVIISFLARLIGLGGIARRVKKIIEGLRRKVNKAVNKALKRIVKKFKKMMGKAKKAAGKLFEWWKQKKPFKVGGETHHIKFKGKGKSAQLMVASTPKTLEAYLKQVETDMEQTDENKERLTDAKKIAGEIDKLKKTTKDGKQEDVAMTKKVGEQISKKMEALSKILATLTGAGAERPPSQIDYDSHGEDGGKVTAKLSSDPGGHSGSQPTQKSKLWKAVNKRKYTYVRGHLLNHHIYGPGIKENLTPITRILNTNMEVEVESEAKKAVLERNEAITYEITAVYGKHKKREHIPEEADLITKFKFKLVKMELEKKDEPTQWTSWKEGASLGGPASMKHELPPDIPVDNKPVLERVNLNNWGSATEQMVRKALRNVGGVGRTHSKSIIDKKGKFSTFKELKTLKKKSGKPLIPSNVVDAVAGYRPKAGAPELFHTDGVTKIKGMD